MDQAFAAMRGRYNFIAAVAELVDGTTPRLVFLSEFDDRITDADGSALVDKLDVALGDQDSEYQTKLRHERDNRASRRGGRPAAAGIGEILRAAFALYQRYWRTLLAVAAVVAVPLTLLQYGIGHWVRSRGEQLDGQVVVSTSTP